MENKRDLLASKLEQNIPAVQKSKPEPQKSKDIQDDYEFSRSTYKQLIQTGMLSLDTLAELARDSEHPRAFEVLSQSIKSIGDTTDKLMLLQKVNKELNKEDKAKDDDENRKITNNNVFVGSTSDLQKMLMAANEKSIINAENQE
tara:strand:- start:234 stop:668 length:435 start_codon:yes stop_codon:yes gene_type:complete